jgi:hypothetical protein
MVREKLEFSVQLHPGAVAGQLKAGQTLIVRPPASQEPGAAKVVECCSTEGSFLGDVPANAQNRLQGLGEVQASIRSVKRDAQGELASLLLRVEFGEDGAPLHPQGDLYMLWALVKVLVFCTAYFQSLACSHFTSFTQTRQHQVYDLCTICGLTCRQGTLCSCWVGWAAN